MWNSTSFTLLPLCSTGREADFLTHELYSYVRYLNIFHAYVKFNIVYFRRRLLSFRYAPLEEKQNFWLVKYIPTLDILISFTFMWNSMWATLVLLPSTKVKTEFLTSECYSLISYKAIWKNLLKLFKFNFNLIFIGFFLYIYIKSILSFE